MSLLTVSAESGSPTFEDMLILISWGSILLLPLISILITLSSPNTRLEKENATNKATRVWSSICDMLIFIYYFSIRESDSSAKPLSHRRIMCNQNQCNLLFLIEVEK